MRVLGYYYYKTAQDSEVVSVAFSIGLVTISPTAAKKNDIPDHWLPVYLIAPYIRLRCVLIYFWMP